MCLGYLAWLLVFLLSAMELHALSSFWSMENDSTYGTYLNSTLSPDPSLVESSWDQLNPSLPTDTWKRKMNVFVISQWGWGVVFYASWFRSSSWLTHWHTNPLVKEGSAGALDGWRLAGVSPLGRRSDFSELECSTVIAPGGDYSDHRLGKVCPLSAFNTQPRALLRVES